MRGRIALLLLLPALLAPAGGTLEQVSEALEQVSESGPVRATLRVAPASPRIGDRVELHLEARAEPAVELLMPEFGDSLDRFTILDFAARESIDASGRTLARQRYVLEPARSGRHVIPPIRIEFVDRRPGRAPGPPGEDAFELFTEPVDLVVASVLLRGAPLVLRPPRGALAPRRADGRPLWPLGLAGLAALAAALPLVRLWLRRRAQARRRSAGDVARAELDSLLARPQPGASEMDAFFVELSGIVRRYLEGRFGLRSPELTTEEFLGVMGATPDLRGDHRRLLQRFLRRADLVKFARQVPDAAAVEESVGAARRFLDETREDAPPPLAGAGRVEGLAGG